mmetsp:Transcript_6514/g.15053  ORF Transcript_6514/g.15053 Transcript_6514/m.15053 type:complete len:206 (+) Transcript_6514:481-1098(+)
MVKRSQVLTPISGQVSHRSSISLRLFALTLFLDRLLLEMHRSLLCGCDFFFGSGNQPLFPSNRSLGLELTSVGNFRAQLGGLLLLLCSFVFLGQTLHLDLKLGLMQPESVLGNLRLQNFGLMLSDDSLLLVVKGGLALFFCVRGVSLRLKCSGVLLILQTLQIFLSCLKLLVEVSDVVAQQCIGCRLIYVLGCQKGNQQQAGHQS